MPAHRRRFLHRQMRFYANLWLTRRAQWRLVHRNLHMACWLPTWAAPNKTKQPHLSLKAVLIINNMFI